MELSVDEQRLKVVSDLLPEHHRRWNAGALASSLPHGGVKRVSRVLGISRKTVARGMREISQPELIDATRVRRAGGGRKDRLVLEPEIGLAFDAVVESCTAGDPMDDEAKWVSMGRSEIARAMEGILGHGVSPYYVDRLLSQKGFRRRKMAKSLPLAQVEERDEQFRNIERLRREYQDEGLPVISVYCIWRDKTATGAQLNGHHAVNGGQASQAVQDKLFDFLDVDLVAVLNQS